MIYFEAPEDDVYYPNIIQRNRVFRNGEPGLERGRWYIEVTRCTHGNFDEKIYKNHFASATIYGPYGSEAEAEADSHNQEPQKTEPCKIIQY